MAGVSASDQRWETNGCSWQSAPACGNTQRSSGTPSAARPLGGAHDHRRGLSTSLLEFMYFGYGSPIMRFPGPGVRISSADFASWIQAYGFLRRPAENRDQSSLTRTRCASMLSPAGGPQRGLEHRVELDRHDEPPGQLAGRAHHQLVADRASGGASSGSFGHISSHRLAGPHPCPPRLASGQDGEIELAALDLRAP